MNQTAVRLGWSDVWTADVDAAAALEALKEAGFRAVVSAVGESVVTMRMGHVDQEFMLWPPTLGRGKIEEALRYAGFSPRP
jgi:hypothetical protein